MNLIRNTSRHFRLRAGTAALLHSFAYGHVGHALGTRVALGAEEPERQTAGIVQGLGRPCGTGRRKANATFFDAHSTDSASQLIFGMDLTPLVADESLDIVEFVSESIRKFHGDVLARLGRRLGKAT